MAPGGGRHVGNLRRHHHHGERFTRQYFFVWKHTREHRMRRSVAHAVHFDQMEWFLSPTSAAGVSPQKMKGDNNKMIDKRIVLSCLSLAPHILFCRTYE